MAASHRTALAAAATVTALTLAACNGSGSASPAPSPTPTVAAPSPTPSPSPEPSPTPTEVLPANDVRDPVEALEAIVAYRDHLFEHPDPDKLELIYAERCECHEQLVPVLQTLVDSGRRLQFAQPRAFELVEVVKREGPLAQIRYRIDAPPAREVGPDEETLQERDGSPGQMQEREAVLVTEGGRWRVVAFV